CSAAARARGAMRVRGTQLISKCAAEWLGGGLSWIRRRMDGQPAVWNRLSIERTRGALGGGAQAGPRLIAWQLDDTRSHGRRDLTSSLASPTTASPAPSWRRSGTPAADVGGQRESWPAGRSP